MDANKLKQQDGKTKIMIISKNTNFKNSFQIQNNGRTLKHHSTVKTLGVMLNHKLTWDNYFSGDKSLITQLKTRTSSVKKIAKYSSPKFALQVANGIFYGKLLYGLELVDGTRKNHLDKLQSIQTDIAKSLNGHLWGRWSTSKHLKTLGWLNINDLCTLVTQKMTHKILNGYQPEELYNLMKNQGNPVTRNYTEKKLGPIPGEISRTARLQLTFWFRSNAYNNLPGSLKMIPGKKTFRKKLKKFMLES